jgi:ABC-type amino acid transport substrate-binding protein
MEDISAVGDTYDRYCNRVPGSSSRSITNQIATRSVLFRAGPIFSGVAGNKLGASCQRDSDVYRNDFAAKREPARLRLQQSVASLFARFIVGGGTLRVGLTEDYRPFSFADVSGKVEGIDVDAMSLAQSLGVRLEIVKTSWSALKSGLETNSFDIAMGGITITLDRQKIGLFSNPVFSSGKTPITHCGDEPKYETIAATISPACT